MFDKFRKHRRQVKWLQQSKPLLNVLLSIRDSMESSEQVRGHETAIMQTLASVSKDFIRVGESMKVHDYDTTTDALKEIVLRIQDVVEMNERLSADVVTLEQKLSDAATGLAEILRIDMPL